MEKMGQAVSLLLLAIYHALNCLSDDGTNEPESDVSCTSTSAAVAADHAWICAFFAHKASTGASCCCKHYIINIIKLNIILLSITNINSETSSGIIMLAQIITQVMVYY